MKPCLKLAKACLQSKISSVLEKIQLIYIRSNRMTSIHAHIIQEYGQEIWYNIYQKWHYQQPHKQVAITSANINIG